MTNDLTSYHDLPGYDYLDEEERTIHARRLATYPKEALQIGAKVDRVLVFHTAFKEAVGAFDRLFQLSKEMNMPHGMRLIGPPGSGKETVFKYFRDSLPKSTMFAPGWGCIGIRAYERPTPGQLVAALLTVFKYPFKRVSDRIIYDKRKLVFELIRQKGTRLVFVDSAHYLCPSSSGRLATLDAGDFIAELMDETRAAVVLSGMEVLGGQESLSQELTNRLSVRNELKNFSANPIWEAVVKGFVDACTFLDMSVLLNDGHPKLLHVAADGNLRSTKRLLTEAAMVCVQQGKRVVEDTHLRVAFDRVFGASTIRTNPYAAIPTVAVSPATA